ncbi:MAG: 6-hydroxymethylpterin diphosphokinase MptE-like protein [Verrucomicrobiota bacterium]
MKSTLLNLIRYLMRKNILNRSILDAKIFRAKSPKIYKLFRKFKGNRCVIIGNGPSLNECDLKLLENEFTFGVNGIFYKTKECGFRPTFYTVEDSHVMRDNLKEIISFEAPYKFFPTNYLKYFRGQKCDNLYFFNMNRGFYEVAGDNYEKPYISTDCSEVVYCGQSVTIINLQLALYMGFSQIYLIGMDFDYEIPASAIVEGQDITSTDYDVNHFHPDYFGKGKKWHDPKLHNVLKSYKHIQDVANKMDVKIFNATKGGKLEVFERVNYENVFKAT